MAVLTDVCQPRLIRQMVVSTLCLGHPCCHPGATVFPTSGCEWRSARGTVVTWCGRHVVRSSRGPVVMQSGRHVVRSSRGAVVTWSSRGTVVTRRGRHVVRSSRGAVVMRCVRHVARSSLMETGIAANYIDFRAIVITSRATCNQRQPATQPAHARDVPRRQPTDVHTGPADDHCRAMCTRVRARHVSIKLRIEFRETACRSRYWNNAASSVTRVSLNNRATVFTRRCPCRLRALTQTQTQTQTQSQSETQTQTQTQNQSETQPRTQTQPVQVQDQAGFRQYY